MKYSAVLLLLVAGILVSAASCPQAPAGATLTARTNRSQTDATLVIEGHGYTPGQTVTITIQNVPGKTGDITRTRTPDPTGKFDIQESFELKHVPAGTDLADVVVIGRDAAGWSLVTRTSASPYVIRV